MAEPGENLFRFFDRWDDLGKELPISQDVYDALTRRDLDLEHFLEIHLPASAGSSIYDALVTGTTDTGADTPTFATPFEAMDYLVNTAGITNARIGVDGANATYTETANVNWSGQSGVHFIIEPIRFGEDDGAVTGLDDLNQFIVWRTGNFTATFGSASTVLVRGMRMNQPGTAGYFTDLAVGYYENCWIQFSATSGGDGEGYGDQIRCRDCDVNFVSTVAMGWGVLEIFDSRITVNALRGTNTVDTWLMVGCDLSWSDNTGGTIQVSDTLNWSSCTNTGRSGGSTVNWPLTISCANATVNIDIDGATSQSAGNRRLYLTLTGAAYAVSVRVRGVEGQLTMPALDAQAAWYVQWYGAWSSMDLTGPGYANLASADTSATPSSVILRGDSILADIVLPDIGSVTSCVEFVACSDSLVRVASPVDAGSKPYEFDASSDDNILIWPIATDAGWGSAGTDAGSGNLIIAASGLSGSGAPAASTDTDAARMSALHGGMF